MSNAKQKIKLDILEKISIMENNTFLFPKSWSKIIYMTDYAWSYRTYHSGSIGNSRYHNIEIYVLGKKLLEILFRGDKIGVSQDLSEKQITMKDVLYYVSAIFDESHSFKNHNEGKKAIRKEITEKLLQIEMLKKEIEALKTRLTDSNKGL